MVLDIMESDGIVMMDSSLPIHLAMTGACSPKYDTCHFIVMYRIYQIHHINPD